MTNKTKKILSAQAGLIMILSAAGSLSALAQSVTPTTEKPPAATLPSASGTTTGAVPNITAGGVPATPAATTPAATTTTAPASTATATATPSGATALPPTAPTGTTPAAVPAVPPAKGAAPKPTTPALSGSVPSPTPQPSAPSAAEMALVQNSGILNTMSPSPPVSSGSMKNGMKVTDILAQPAVVRPLPEKYLIVKKDRDSNDSDARLTSARSALWRGQYQTALEIFDDLYKKKPHDTRIIMGRAVALQKLGQTDEALAAYQGVLADDPKNVEALTNMLGLIRGQDMVTAVEKLKHLRDLYPANADVTAQLGMVYGVSGDYANAVKYLDMADTLKPGNPVVLYNKAVAYDHMGHELEAADMYRRLLLIVSNGDFDRTFPLEAIRNRLAAMR